VVLYDFPTAIAGDPNFRDEGLTCDTNTFAGEQVMWSKEAYSPMRAHAFVIPTGSCGVGGDSAGGTTPPSFTGPLPLLIAHGITGSADGEQTLDSIAKTVVPGLAQPGYTLRTDTGAVSSVWDNGNKVADDAQRLIDATGAPNINVIAHSKGGLDTRYAMFLTPWEFHDLGMLSTPNGGSAEADKLCFIRGLPFGGHVESGFGACDSDKNGLYDLQTW
jgi:triacylglycerol esterase/lipase EstA (alpha/beta hydrolase family)